MRRIWMFTLALLPVALATGIPDRQLYEENLVAVLDVVNWEDLRAMNDSSLRVYSADGKPLEAYRNPRFKLSDGAAFTPRCVWIAMPAYNPYARAEPNAARLAQSVACIDRISNAVRDFAVPGMTAQTPSATTDGSGVIFGSGSRPVIVLARDDQSIKIFDASAWDKRVDLTLKTPVNHVHFDGSYYQVVDMGVRRSAVLKLDERTLEVKASVEVDRFNLGGLHRSGNRLFATQRDDTNNAVAIFELDLALKVVKTHTRNLACLSRTVELGMREGQLIVLDRASSELRAFDFVRCTAVTAVDRRARAGSLKRDVVFFHLGDGSKQVPAFNFKRGAWTTIEAGKSVDWVR
jgi:hypothetical protein